MKSKGAVKKPPFLVGGMGFLCKVQFIVFNFLNFVQISIQIRGCYFSKCMFLHDILFSPNWHGF